MTGTSTSGWTCLRPWEVDALHVARAPGDADGHKLRIRHALAAGDRDALLGAFVDLWLADVPPRRRRRLLGSARRHLDRATRRALASSASRGLDQSHPLAQAPYAVLAAGVTGTTRLVTTGPAHRRPRAGWRRWRRREARSDRPGRHR